MKARIEELVNVAFNAMQYSSVDEIRATINRSMTTLAEECYERAAKECEEMVLRETDYGAQLGVHGSRYAHRTGPECAEAIRAFTLGG